MKNQIKEVAVLDKGFVRLVDVLGEDLTVVNAARVSFDKKSVVFSEKDAKLIKYLATHQHWTPFGHPQVTLHIKMPIFVARQFMRSGVGIRLSEPADGSLDTDIPINEVSRRYVDSPPEFYVPIRWRKRPDGSIKQGSGTDFTDEENDRATAIFISCVDSCVNGYNRLLNMSAAPEQARMALPVGSYTEFWITPSLAATARLVKLRIDPHAQWEIQEYGRAISKIMEPLFPVSWPALLEM